MLDEHVEEIDPELLHLGLLLLGEPVLIRIHLGPVGELVADVGTREAIGVGQHREVELGEERRHSQGHDGLDGVVILVDDAIVDIVFQNHVSLHADGRHGQSLGQQRPEEACHALHLLGLVHGEVVVVEQGIGVGLMGILEGKRDVVGAQDLIEQALSGRPIVLEGLVHHVPRVDTSLEMPHDSEDMLAHAFAQHLGGHGLALAVEVEPWRALRVPDEAVAQHLHAGSLGLVDKLVGKGEVVDTLLGMDDLTLHAVLCHGPVEVAGDDGPVGVARLCLPLVHAHAGVPVVAVGLPKAILRHQGKGCHNQNGGHY